jgi:hypothetical protein
MAVDNLSVIEDMTVIVEELLRRAEVAKPSHRIEPPLTSLDFVGLLEQLGNDPQHYAVIETACRNTFHSTIVSMILTLAAITNMNRFRLLYKTPTSYEYGI